MDVIEELKSFWENSQKKIQGGRGRFGGGGGGSGWMRIISFFLGGGGVPGGGGGGGGGGGQVWGVRMDVNEELKFLVKIQRKKKIGGGSGGSGWGGGGSGWM